MRFETRCLHGGFDPYKFRDNPALVPIYQNTSFLFHSPEEAGELFSLEKEGHLYSRISNPTVEVLEKRISVLEGGISAVATSSGQSAITLAILTLAREGDEIISSPYLYGGTYTLFKYTLSRLGIRVKFVDVNQPNELKKAITEKTKAVYGEVLGNPSLIPLDIELVSKVCHEEGIPLIVDNTFATPYLVQPIRWGADIVVHSLTKYLSGHGTSIGGVVVDSGRFDWEKSSRFYELVREEPAYHGLNFKERFGDRVFSSRLRALLLRDIGSCLSPMNAYFILLGIETLHLRMQRHSENAMAVAEYLADHPKVARVFYPGLEGGEWYNLARKYFSRNMYGGMVCFSLVGGREAGKRFIHNLPLFYHLANVGDARSLVIHPASTTHQQLDPEELNLCGIDEGFIRLSIGLEAVEDIISALDQALNSV